MHNGLHMMVMVLYSAVSSPLDRSKRFTLSSPGRPVHSDTVLCFSWKHSSHAAIAQRLLTHISTTVYSQVLIYTAESTEASCSERKCPNFETVTTGIRTRALSIASPAFYQLSYRAPQIRAPGRRLRQSSQRFDMVSHEKEIDSRRVREGDTGHAQMN